MGSDHFVEHLSPVTQNIIHIHPERGRPKRARYELVSDGITMPLGVADLPFSFRNSYLGKFAVHLTKPGETAIVYCNRPSTADDVAQDIAAEIHSDRSERALDDLASFLRQEVHRDYGLASIVGKGVAFHYGNIPQIIRGRLEELLKDRTIRFVCCTSTLLQGMNLPAKNIFVENPKRGSGSPMQKGDFWNLAGRAGRLSKEFSGNVFCIFGDQWENDVFSQGRLSPIRSAFQTAVVERTDELIGAIQHPPERSESGLVWAEQAFARIYADYVAHGRRLRDAFATETSAAKIDEIDSLTEAFHQRRTLPDEIYTTNWTCPLN